jgi:hypothetical protein
MILLDSIIIYIILTSGTAYSITILAQAMSFIVQHLAFLSQHLIVSIIVAKAHNKMTNDFHRQ